MPSEFSSYSFSRKATFLIGVFLIHTIALNVAGAEIYRVDDDASPGGDGHSWATAYDDIERAVDALYAHGGGEIWVAAGRYTGDGPTVVGMREGVHIYGGFSGTETSRNQRDWTRYQSVIDGLGQRRCVRGADNATLNGFLIEGGFSIKGGAGMENYNCSPTVVNCVFRNNKARYGGGVCNYTNLQTPVIKNCVFVGNVADEMGGGAYNKETSAVFVNCTFLENQSALEYGGGLCSESSSDTVVNSVFWNNGQEVDSLNSNLTLTYCCIQGGMSGEGNINADPRFESISYSPLPDSPCIDAGNSSLDQLAEVDLLGRDRVQGANVDIGATEYVPGSIPVDVTITLAPEEALSQNPRFSVLFGRWLESGMTFSTYPGSYFINFSSLVNWQKPAEQLLIVSSTDTVKEYTYSFSEGENRWYVDIDAIGAGTGVSWADAFTDIQSAIEATLKEKIGEIWVAQGTYTGNSGEVLVDYQSAGEYVLVMRSGAHLYGGFSGTETTREQRNWNLHQTIIDAERDRSCVFGASDATLDGFVIINAHSGFGAMLNHQVSPMVENCAFMNNSCNGAGGILNRSNSSPTVSHCLFQDNYSPYYGGGISNLGGSSPAIRDCQFIWNESELGFGGGIANREGSSPLVENCLFYGNTSTYRSGAGIGNRENSTPIVTNCLFKDNTAGEYGGGLYNENSSPVVINCTFSGNSSELGGDGMYLTGNASPTVVNSIFWNKESEIVDDGSGSDPTITYSCVKNGYTGTGNIDLDPKLDEVNALLLEASPCRDSGNSSVGGLPETDLAGNARILNSQVDMGAYEFVPGSESVELIVNLGPADVLPLKPKVRFTQNRISGPWLENGDTIALYPGEYQLEYTSFIHWIEPTEENIQIQHDDTSVTLNYTYDLNSYLWYVDVNATGGNNGTSWQDAFTSMQSAVDAAAQDGLGEIWVADGTYTGIGDHVLEMAEGVLLFGGFSGVETARNQRNWMDNKTIIHGENARRCVIGADYATLDGFILTKGSAIGLVTEEGGGMYNRYSPTVRNCIFKENHAYFGAGMYNGSCSPEITNCIFEGNISNYGGGIYSHGESSVVLSHCTFSNNHARQGAGIYLFESTQDIENCIFSGNIAILDTTEVMSGAAIFNLFSNVRITNCLFEKNIVSGDNVKAGTGIYNYYADTELTNCTFNQNQLQGNSITGGAIYSFKSSLVIKNCISWENGTEIYNEDSDPAVSYSCIQGGYTGTGNIDPDPMLDMVQKRPLPGSPCINAGDGSSTGLPETDLFGQQRIADTIVDMGCSEYIPGTSVANLTIRFTPEGVLPLNPHCQFSYGSLKGPWLGHDTTVQLYPDQYGVDFSTFVRWREPEDTSVMVTDGNQIKEFEYTYDQSYLTWYVDCDATGTNDGKSWENAFTDIQSAVDEVYGHEVNEIWVAGGVYTDSRMVESMEDYNTYECNVHLKDGANLYGGFAGNETERDQRNIRENITIIDGERRRLCIYGSSRYTLDGFTITNGYGMYFAGMRNYLSTPVIKNCQFINNHATREGAGIKNTQTDATIENCVFAHNSTYDGNGAGIYNDYSFITISGCEFIQNYSALGNGSGIYNSDHATVTISDCTFLANTTFQGSGAGVASYHSSTELNRCFFDGNSSGNFGGGVSIVSPQSSLIRDSQFINNHSDKGGAIYLSKASPDITNCVFDQNEATSGSVLHAYYASYPDLINCTLVNNNSAEAGSTIWSGTAYIEEIRTLPWPYPPITVIVPYPSIPTATNCIFQGNGEVEFDHDEDSSYGASYSCINASYPGEGNIDVDPLFANPANGNYRLLASSPCINTGTSEGAPNEDIRGLPRPYGIGVDIGAYEYSNVSPPMEIPLAIIGILDGQDLYDLNQDGIIDAADLLVD